MENGIFKIEKCWNKVNNERRVFYLSFSRADINVQVNVIVIMLFWTE